MQGSPRGGVTALLGPTNTGKTHRAVERMLEHGTGMIGLPLRLLAREIYDRVSARLGENAAALITGEEKRIPRRPRYWICTVESMPLDREVDFVGIDEVQLVTHPQRGHVFTDRLLNARGREETWFMGADTMRPLMESLVPTAEVQRHPRLSKLKAAGALGLAALPPRTAVIAFSAAEVYHLADRLKRRRGGAAVVLGALSPRTRNAQVAMYQSGEVDFLVATDAVGMGLNMDVDHVAFASLRKFDGFRMRNLTPAEIAQIAGRAGRYTRDGTFGTITPVELADDVTFAVEHHRFAPVRQAMWRNSDLDMSSVDALLVSLGARPRRHGLHLVHKSSDQAVLEILAARDDIRERSRSDEAVSLLWDVCRIPDFRKLLAEHHAVLLAEIFVQLRDQGRIEPAYMNERIARLESTTGDIDELMMRMDFIRTWAYVAYHGDWLDDPQRWQDRTRTAEDQLSDALHARLIDRFVERKRKGRRSSPSGRKSSRKSSRGQRERELIEDGPFAKLAELRDAIAPEPVEVVRDAWVEGVVDARHEQFSVSGDGVITLTRDGTLDDVQDDVVTTPVPESVSERIGRMTRGADIVHPEVKVQAERKLGAGATSRILRRLRAWARDMLDGLLGPLKDPRLDSLGASGRGLLYQLERSLTTIDVHSARDQLRDLPEPDREALGALDIVFGRRVVFVATALDHASLGLRTALASAWFKKTLRVRGPALRWHGEATQDAQQLLAQGYGRVGSFAVRADLIEEVLSLVGPLSEAGPFEPPPALAELTQMPPDDVRSLLVALGFHETHEGFIEPQRPRRRRSRRGRR